MKWRLRWPFVFKKPLRILRSPADPEHSHYDAPCIGCNGSGRARELLYERADGDIWLTPLEPEHQCSTCHGSGLGTACLVHGVQSITLCPCGREKK